jgi:protein-tyrosine phosphatase
VNPYTNVPSERETIESQGIEYVKQPTSSDFSTFSDALDRVSEKKIHVHCAANYRVSAFYSLYMARNGLWSAEEAKAFIHSIRQPIEHPGWFDFITGVLADINAQRRVPADHRGNERPADP